MQRLTKEERPLAEQPEIRVVAAGIGQPTAPWLR
jgi:hypothetical protein